MSDLSDLHGIYPTALRWNAEDGILGKSVFNSETGERELQEIELGKPATFVLDLATRERGYGLIKVGLYDMRLTPVGSPPPPWPDDDEFKPALGCWLWNPKHGELRLETNAKLFCEAISDLWDRARSKPEAIEGLSPAVRFTDRATRHIKSINKSFFIPVIEVIGWVPRDKVPGWESRSPTVAPPAAPPALPDASEKPAAIVTTPVAHGRAKGKTTIVSGRGGGADIGKRRPDLARDIDPDPSDEIPF